MTDTYTDSDEYQKEIAKEYEKRVLKYSTAEVSLILQKLGITVPASAITEAVVGNVNATYLAPEIVVKIHTNKSEPEYLANKVVSDALSSQYPVVRVRAYDFYEKTDYEVLVMERARGTLLLDDIFDLSATDLAHVFRQVLAVVRQMQTILFQDFGNVNSAQSYPTYTAYLTDAFTENMKQVREQQLCDEGELRSVEEYFFKHVSVFDSETSVFVHDDLHTGNILHDGDRLTAVIDFDHPLRAPPLRVLCTLLGFIDNPSQFVEGTKDFPLYKGKNFYSLLPILKDELRDIVADPLLLRKLNILFIHNGIDLIAANWSKGLNEHIMRMIMDAELVQSDEGLVKTYYGLVLAGRQ